MKRLLFTSVFAASILLFVAGAFGTEDAGKQKLKPALLVIDIQNEYLKYIPENDKTIAFRMVNGAIWMFRQHGFPVIRVYNTNPSWGPEPGSEAFEFPSSINVTEDDPKIVKNFANAFKKTDLKKLLEDKGCNAVFLCGLSAVGCVLATYFGATDNDLRVMMVKGAIMSHNTDYTNFVEDICDTVSFEALDILLNCAQE